MMITLNICVLCFSVYYPNVSFILPNHCFPHKFQAKSGPYLTNMITHDLVKPLNLPKEVNPEKAMAPHSSTLAWKIPWMEEPGRLPVHGVAKSRRRLSDFTFTFHFHALEKEMATHSSVLAWRIPWTEKPGRLQSMGLHRVGHDWSDLAAAAATARGLLP